MHSKVQLFVLTRDGESEEQATKRAKAELNELPLLHARWLELKSKLSTDDCMTYLEIEKFFPDFLYFWHLSSPRTLAVLGEKDCYEILELVAPYKTIIWDVCSVEYFEFLPDELTIYRGGFGSVADVAAGHSWTLNRDIAAIYAVQANGILITAQISKEDVLLLVTLEHEIVPRKSGLENIRLLSRA